MKLRWYQEQAVDAVWNYLRTNPNGAPCVVLPTGSGKTLVIAELCRQVVAWGGRALVLAHVKELLEQSAEKLSRFVDASTVGVYSAGLNERTTSTPIVVAGIQSVYQRANELGPFHLIIVDEAHLIPPTGTGRYRTFLDAEKTISPKARLVGLTATPFRTGCGWITKDRATDDESSTGYDRLLDEIVYEAPTSDLIKDGTLALVTSRAAKRAPDFSGVHVTRGEFDEQEVEKVLSKKNVLESACSEIVEKTKDRKKVLVFCARVESARRCAKLLNEYDESNVAAIVSGETSAGDRAELVRRFKNERGDVDLFGTEQKPLKYIVNVGVFTTGFDAPNVDCVAILRPTKSLALYHQIVGRGLRTSPEKSDCLILDFGGNIDRHGPIDIARPTANYSDVEKTWKTCRNCGAVVAREYPVCPLCGEPFAVPRGAGDPDSELERKSSSGAVTSKDYYYSDDEEIVEEYDVETVEYSAHYKKDAEPGTPPTFQICYRHNRFGRPIFEWLCPEHEKNFPVMKYREWWEQKSKISPPPNAELAALYANNGALATPTKIRTRRKQRDRFARVEWVEFSEIPDFDETAVVNPDEADDGGWGDFDQFDEPETQPITQADAIPDACATCANCSPNDNGAGFYCREWNCSGVPDGVAPEYACWQEPIDEGDIPF